MKNELALKNLIDRYNALAYTHEYIFGYTDRGNVYATLVGADVLPFVCCLDQASRGAGCALRFKPNRAQKELLKVSGETFMVCTEKFFDDLYAETCYNRGEIFEKLVTEYYGQCWVKDHIPFTEGGDIEVAGVAYQIKYEKATFTNEKTLANLKG